MNYWDKTQIQRRHLLAAGGATAAEETYWTQWLERRGSRRRVLAGGAAAGIGLFAAACAGSSSKSGAPSATSGGSNAASPARAGGTPTGTQAAGSAQAAGASPKKGGTLRWGIEADPPNLDPVFVNTAATQELGMNLYEQLFNFDANAVPQPVLVKDFSTSADRLTYTFNLRPDASFEGGRPVLSSDVVASIQRWSKAQAAGISLFQSVNSLEAKGDSTVVLELKQPYSILLETLASGSGAPFIMTKEAASTPATQAVTDVVASGPFKLDSWEKGNKIVLKRRDDYKSPAGPASNFAGTRTVYLDAVEIPIIADQNSRLAAFQSGQIGLMTQPLNDYYDQLKGAKDTQILQWKYGVYVLFVLNHTKPPFNNVLARQAVQAGINIDQLMTAGFGKSLWTKGPGIFLTGSPNDSNASAELFDQHNLPKAKQLFQQLQQSGGYDGSPIVLLSNTSYPYLFNMSTVVKPMLESIGFKVELQTPDAATALSTRVNKDKWDMFNWAGHSFGGADPLTSLLLNSQSASSGWYQNPKMDDLKAQFAAAASPEQKKTIIDQVQTLWYQDVPTVLLGQYFLYDAFKTYVNGFSNSPQRYPFWNVWLDR